MTTVGDSQYAWPITTGSLQVEEVHSRTRAKLTVIMLGHWSMTALVDCSFYYEARLQRIVQRTPAVSQLEVVSSSRKVEALLLRRFSRLLRSVFEKLRAIVVRRLLIFYYQQ